LPDDRAARSALASSRKSLQHCQPFAVGAVHNLTNAF
jgi:hypothetical protein